MSARGRAPARTALVGNPSDGYDGAVLALALGNWEASVRVVRSAVEDRVDGPVGLAPLVHAARRTHRRAIGPAPAALLQVETTIPREVGLAGSSAVVVATLLATAAQTQVPVDPERWPSLALSAETDELGIPGGLQDRVAQVWGGLTLCDVRPDATQDVNGLVVGAYRAVDRTALPPLAVAWLPTSAESSAAPHHDLRRRWRTGDRTVRVGMRQLRELAIAAAQALDRHDAEPLVAGMQRTFELRRALVPLRAEHEALVDRLEQVGAAANYSGSGGAVVSTVPDDDLERLAAAVRPLGARVERARVA